MYQRSVVIRGRRRYLFTVKSYLELTSIGHEVASPFLKGRGGGKGLLEERGFGEGIALRTIVAPSPQILSPLAGRGGQKQALSHER